MTAHGKNGDHLQFGRRTISALMEYLEWKLTWSQLRQLLFKYELGNRFQGPNKLAALSAVFHPLVVPDADPNDIKKTRELLEAVIQDAHGVIRAYENGSFSVPIYDHSWATKTYEILEPALRADGLDIVEGRIATFLSPTVEPAVEQGSIELSLESRGFTVAKNHLNQAMDNGARANWESANSQVRAFLEALCDSITAQIYSKPGDIPKGGEARQYLKKVGFLSIKESDLLKAFFQVLHGQGGHAGTSDSADCHRRRLMAVAMANYYLDRLDKWGEEC